MSHVVSRYLTGEIDRLRLRGQRMLARRPSIANQTAIWHVLHDLDQLPSSFAESFQWQALASAAGRLREIDRAAFGPPAPPAATTDRPHRSTRGRGARADLDSLRIP